MRRSPSTTVCRSTWGTVTAGPRASPRPTVVSGTASAGDGTSEAATRPAATARAVLMLGGRSWAGQSCVRAKPRRSRRRSARTLLRMILRMSSLFVRTLRDDPADAEVPSHRLLVRAGYIRRAAPGIYTWLPLGLRVLRKIENIIREEMDAIGAPGAAVPRAAAPRALRGERPLDGVRRRHLPAQGPQGRRLPARPHARGDVHPRREGPVLVVQGPAAVRSTRSRPSTATRHGPAPGCCAAASS